MCDVAWYNEFLALNPSERKKRDLIVQYAELRGGAVESYFRRVFARYWLMVESVPPGTEGDSLGFTAAQQARLLADMAKAVVPALRQSSGFAATSSSTSGDSALKYPQSVAHL